MHEMAEDNELLATKLGRSLLPKFPRDQDERLWQYIRSKILGPEHQDLPDPIIADLTRTVNGEGGEEDEESIDDDEDSALNIQQQLPSSIQVTPANSAPAVASTQITGQDETANNDAPMDFSRQRSDGDDSDDDKLYIKE